MMIRNSIRFSLACLVSVAAIQAPSAMAYQLDTANHTLSVSPGTTAAATTTDLRNAVNYLANRSDKITPWTMKLAPGKYTLTGQITAKNLQNVNFVSNMNQPAQLIKMDGWNSATSGEYLVKFLFGKNISMTGMQFYGSTTFANNVDPVWPDQGVDFGSCNGVTVKNNGFFNFGNSALRVTTTESDPVKGVNSFNTTVANNLFNNIYQISTTPNDEIHGGTANYVLQSNVFYNLRGSIKFASRTSGAKNVKILSNKINGGDHFGFEINNYNDMEIRGNNISNVASVAINVYNNTRATEQFVWGNNFTIADNAISNVGRGIRFSNEPYASGYTYVPQNVKITNNTLSGVTEMSSWPAVYQTNGKVNGLTLTGNKLTNVSNKKYFGYMSTSTNVTYSNNLVNGTAYGPQQTTATK